MLLISCAENSADVNSRGKGSRILLDKAHPGYQQACTS